MTISFSRSMRSLDQDAFRPSLVGLALAVVMLAAWMAWLFLARLAMYESSTHFSVRRNGNLVVTFAPDAYARLRPGQPATVRLSPPDGEDSAEYSGEVLDLLAPDRAEIFVFMPERILDGATGEVRVAVEQASPAQLILRSVGQFIEDKRLRLSPSTTGP